MLNNSSNATALFYILLVVCRVSVCEGIFHLSRMVKGRAAGNCSTCNNIFGQQALIHPFSFSQQINERGKGERSSVNKSEINCHNALWNWRQEIKASFH